MIALSRVPARNSLSCSAMYTALWPARRGHWGVSLLLLPLGPWQEEHTADLVAPAAAVPCANGSIGPEPAAGSVVAAPVAVGALAGAGAAAAGAVAGGGAAFPEFVCASAGTCTRANATVAASAAPLSQLIFFAILSFRFVPRCEGAE